MGNIGTYSNILPPSQNKAAAAIKMTDIWITEIKTNSSAVAETADRTALQKLRYVNFDGSSGTV